MYVGGMYVGGKVCKVGSICWIVVLTTYLVFLFGTLCLPGLVFLIIFTSSFFFLSSQREREE